MNSRSNPLLHALLTACGTTKGKSASSVSFVIIGQPVSLKNRRRLLKNRLNGKLFSAKSKEAEAYMRDFYLQTPPEYRGIKLGSLKSPLRLILTAYYRSRRSDLDIAIVMDSLQKAEVIRNDRDIIEQHLYAEVDPKNPRVELVLEEI